MVESVAFADAFHMTTQATTPIPEPPVSRRLTRSSTDRVIAGVAGGAGRYFSIDPAIVRLALIVLSFFGGAGFIVYGAAWLIVPSDDAAETEFKAGAIARRILIVLGVLALIFVAAMIGFWGFAAGGTATAIVVLALGALLVVGAFTGGMRWLILPAIALALSAGVAAAADLDISGGTGERFYAPATTAALQPNYRLGVGHLRLDLRNTEFGPGNHRVHLKVGVGQAEVLVPDDVCVSSTAHIAAGATQIFDHTSGGAYHDWEDLHRAPAGTPQLAVAAAFGFRELRSAHGPCGTTPGGSGCADG